MNARALFGLQQIKERSLLCVIGLRRIAWRWTDAAITFFDQILDLQIFTPPVAPLFARPFVQQFGEGLGHNRVVIVVIALEPRAKLFQADACGYGEAADVVDPPILARRDEVGQRLIVLARAFFALLAQRVEDSQNARTILVGVDLDVVADRVGRPETVNGVRPQFPAADDAFEQRSRVLIKFARLRARGRIVENAREYAFQLPRVKERRPVNELDDLFEGIVFEQPDACEFGP